MGAFVTKKRWIIVIIVAVLLVAIVGASIAKSQKQGFDVEVATVKRGDVAPTVTADGIVTAKNTVNISSQIMGEITAIPYKEGAHVKKGDLLVQINPDTYQRDVLSGKANLDSAEVAARQADVTLAQRKLDWERAQDLFDKKILSVQQRDDSKLAYDQAVLGAKSSKAMVEQARAAYQRAQDYLAKTTMRSPIDGVVTAVNAKEGETAVMGTMNFAGTVILTVSDLSEIITEVQVDEADFPRLKMDQPVVVTVDALGGKKYDGKVIEIGASAKAGASGVQSNIRQFTVKVAIENPDALLRPGITARVRLIADKRTGVLRAPLGAIRTEEKEGSQSFFVFTDVKGKALKKAVQTGLSDDLYTEIADGLKEGDKVVSGPYRILRTMHDGDKLKSKEVKEEDLKKAKKDATKVEVD
jgi:HlyD family secretion protein